MASGLIDQKALPRRGILSRPRAVPRCALKGHTKGNQSLAALDLDAESTENVPFFVSVTRPDRTTSSSIRFWRGARTAQIDLIEGANAASNRNHRNDCTELAYAVRSGDVLLKPLFHADSYWRDLLALTWRIRTVNGADAILRGLRAHIGSARPAAFRLDPRRAM